jgi:hypothetical protein
MRYLCLAIVAAAAVLGASSVQAAEGGQSPYLKGYRDVLSGILPPEPGIYLRNDTVYYSGDVGQAVLNGRVEAGLEVSTVADLVSATKVTGAHLFGGQYAYGVAAGLVWAEVEVSATGARRSLEVDDDVTNFSDVILLPVVLGWHKGSSHWSAGAGVVVPNGTYDTDKLANTSHNYPTLLFTGSYTWFDPNAGWDASVAGAYLINGKNQATDYTTGNLLHVDAAVTRHFGKWQAGLVGYAMVQTTDDHGPGARLGAFRSQVYGAGPIVGYDVQIAGRPVTLLGKWYREFDGNNTVEGDTVGVAFAFKF